MPNDTRCSDEQIAMWIQIYVDSGIPNIKEAISARAKSFDNLYECYRKKLYTYLLLMSGTKDLAEQIFPSTWEKIINNRAELAAQAKNGTLNFRACIFTIARRSLLQHVNELKLLELSQLNDLPASIVDFGLKIAQLPLQKRDTYLLRRMGLSLAEIVQVQHSKDCEQKQPPSKDISVSEVRSLLILVMQDLKSPS